MFELNDRVHCTFNDKDGTITSLTNPESDSYPLVVTFDDGTEDVYSISGSWCGEGSNIIDLTKIS